ncbi:MAG: phytanoyl-CoA dioxygenase family protein, partial [Acidimicrobiales bacterium]
MSADRYPTRAGGESLILPRLDPVVYPSSGGPLSPGQVKGFEADGFLEVDRLLDDQTIQSLRAELDRLADDPELGASERVIREPTGLAVRSIFELHVVSPLIRTLIADPRVVAPARQLLGSDVYVHQSRANLKPGFDGREFSWHSDFETWHAEDGMPRMRA